MTYLQFHLVFNLPLFLLLLWLLRGRWTRARVICMALMCAVAFIATTPWDNWAVHQGIWGFDWARATPVEIPFAGTLYRLPAEEYAFFIIMSVIVSMLCLLFLPNPRRPAGADAAQPKNPTS